MSRSSTVHPTDEDLQAYLDHELTLPAVAEHLPGCSACAARLEQLQTLFTRVESLPEATLGRDLSPAVLRQLAPAPGRLRLLAGLQVAAAVVGLLLALPWLAASPPSGELGSAAESRWASWADGTEQLLAGVAAELSTSLDRLAAPSLMPGLPPIPVPQLWLLAGSGLLLWAVGNGLLLGRSGIRRRDGP